MTAQCCYPSVRDPYVSGGVLRNGAIGNGINDDSDAFEHWCAVTRGPLRVPAPFTYKLTRQIPFLNDGLVLFGDDYAGSVILNDIAGSDFLFDLDKRRCCILTGLTIDASSPRTQGGMVRVRGGDPNVQLSPFQISYGGNIIDVDANNQFHGVSVEDDDDDNGDFGTTIGNPWRMAFWRNCNGAGRLIHLNTPHGASQFIHKIFVKGIAGQAPVGLQVTATGGLTCTGMQTHTVAQAVSITPSVPMAESVTLLQFGLCQFDSATGDNFDVNMTNGATTRLFIELANCWVAGSAANNVRVRGTGGAALECVNIVGGQNFAAGGYGVKVENGIGNTKVRVDPSLYFADNALGNTDFT